MFRPKPILYAALMALILLARPADAARKDILSILDGLKNLPNAPKLTAWIETTQGNVEAHHLGEELRLNLQSSQDAYIYVVRVDSNGVGWLVIPRIDDNNLLQAGQPAIYPNFGETGGLFARLPLGAITTFVIATAQPIDTAAAIGSEIEIGAAKTNFEELKQKLHRASDSRLLAAVKLEHKVKGRKGESQFSAAEIVSYFTTTTRAIQRPTLPADIRFEFGSAELTPEAKKNLDEWGAALSNPLLQKNKFRVAGHTDDVGSDDFNMKLSSNRAVAVKEYLIKHHRITPDRLITEGHGKAAPLDRSTNEEARAANRRVEFVMPRN